jgi:hypothetical protein
LSKSAPRPQSGCSFTLFRENSYWISGENEEGDIVLTQAGRIYYWPETSLAEEAHSMLAE